MPPLVALVRWLDDEVAEQRPQHHVHLHVREGRANAPPGATPERDPLIAVGPAAHEAVRVEAPGVREHGVVAVSQVDARDDHLPFWQRPPAEPHGRGAYLAG